MSFLTALGYYTGAHNQAKAQAEQQQFQNDLSQREFGLEQQRAAEQAKIDQANIDSLNRQNAQTESNRKFESGLQLPPHWAKMPDGDKISYLQHRQNAALKTGDMDVYNATQSAINGISLGSERLSTVDVNRQGRIPLMQSQAQHFRQLHGEFEQRLQQAWRIADASTRARMYAAQQSAGARLASSQISNDEKAYIATMTALNVANRMDSTQAFQAAMAQYHSASQQWQAQEKQYNLGLAPNPGTAPTPQQFIINAPAAGTPKVIVVPITLPNGRTVNAPVVQPKPPHPTVAQEIDNIRAAMAQGAPQARIVQMLQQRVQSGSLSGQDEQQILRTVFGHPAQ